MQNKRRAFLKMAGLASIEVAGGCIAGFATKRIIKTMGIFTL
jgi:hypothetical protein